MTLSLATELAAARNRAAVLCQQEETAEFAAQVRLSWQIATRMIAEIPAFLRGIASTNRGSQAYLVGLETYRPWKWEWPNHEGLSDRHRVLSSRQCQRLLFGVPRHIAVWATSQGMTVEVRYGTAMPEWAVFEHGQHGYRHHCHRGIIVSW